MMSLLLATMICGATYYFSLLCRHCSDPIYENTAKLLKVVIYGKTCQVGNKVPWSKARALDMLPSDERATNVQYTLNQGVPFSYNYYQLEILAISFQSSIGALKEHSKF